MMYDDKIQKLIKLIRDALENIEDEYYKITTTYAPLGIVRERVFCYELYHQMRLLQDGRGLKDITIHGEIDKSGHGQFSSNARLNPDFVFHVPGMMQENIIVVEVKGNVENNGIYKDIKTLSKFTNEKHYYRLGVLIIYNFTKDEFWGKTGNFINNKISESKINTLKILVLCKKCKNTPSEIINLNELIKRCDNGRT